MSLPTAEYFFNIYLPLILSLSVHEYAHARAALFLGDDTAKHLGRITLNPFVHIDPIGTILLPLLGVPFGWAKPVPFNPVRFNKDISMRAGGALVALAGPISNLFLCVLAYSFIILLRSYGETAQATSGFYTMLIMFLRVNIVLAIFNLIPIPPLDGHHIVNMFIPLRFKPYWDVFLAKGQILLLVVFLMFGGLIGGAVGWVLNFLGLR